MKKILSLLVLAMGLSVFTACNDDEVPANGYIETTEEGSSTMILKGYISSSQGFSVLQPSGFAAPVYIKDGKLYGKFYNFIRTTDTKLDAMTTVPESGNWESEVGIYDKATYWARYAGSIYKYIKLRVAYIDENNVGIEYVVSSHSTTRPNSNSNMENPDQTAWELEIPHLDSNNFYAPHTVKFEGNTYMNLAIEWNSSLRHANWVAFYYDSNTARSLVSRGSNWAWDPAIPTSLNPVQESDHKSDGFDKGHLCASSDRLFSSEANDQTFYYSNISPMTHRFNNGFWIGVEDVVSNWGHSTIKTTYDKVYVTKGGTLNNLLKNFIGKYAGNDGIVPYTNADGLTKHGLAVPAYYYAAVLAEKDGKYQAIAFLVEHNDDLSANPSANELKSKVVTIDELEKFTGLDFFCNLTDEVEEAVESTVDVNLWEW